LAKGQLRSFGSSSLKISTETSTIFRLNCWQTNGFSNRFIEAIHGGKSSGKRVVVMGIFLDPGKFRS
jgi:hypothetical protein